MLDWTYEPDGYAGLGEFFDYYYFVGDGADEWGGREKYLAVFLGVHHRLSDLHVLEVCLQFQVVALRLGECEQYILPRGFQGLKTSYPYLQLGDVAVESGGSRGASEILSCGHVVAVAFGE